MGKVRFADRKDSFHDALKKFLIVFNAVCSIRERSVDEYKKEEIPR